MNRQPCYGEGTCAHLQRPAGHIPADGEEKTCRNERLAVSRWSCLG